MFRGNAPKSRRKLICRLNYRRQNFPRTLRAVWTAPLKCCCTPRMKRGRRPAGSRRKICPWFLARPAAKCRWAKNIFNKPSPRRSLKKRQPTRVVHYQVQQQGLNLCSALGFQGPLTTISNACASGANAIGHAWEMLRNGRAEKVLTGGYDTLCQLTFAGFDSLQALSPTPCRPFDAQRDGLTLGEGAAILTLETLAHAKKRGAEILGEITGYGAATDTHHLTQPHPEGNAALGRDDRRVRVRAKFHRRKLITSTRTARPRRTTTRPRPPQSTVGRARLQKKCPSVRPRPASAICSAGRARLKRSFASWPCAANGCRRKLQLARPIPRAILKLRANRRMQKLRQPFQIRLVSAARTPRSFSGGGREPDFRLRRRRSFTGGLGCFAAAFRLGSRRINSHASFGTTGFGKAVARPHRAAAGSASGIFYSSAFAPCERHHAAHRGRRA